MQRVNKIAKDISTTCSSNDATDANTSNSGWDYLKDLTDEDEKHYFASYLTKLRNDGEDITRSINKLLETRNKLKKEGLTLYKEIIIDGCLIPIYKKLEPAKGIKGYYTTFNGLLSIPWKNIDKTSLDVCGLEEELEALKLV